ncbi:MAG: ATP-binding protein [Geothrix sp.]|nr:ATP-binding protein [Geothrix sp.]
MLARPAFLEHLHTAAKRSPITALLGPRQCGKTTLARLFAEGRQAAFFDMESVADQRRLQNPELALGELEGLVVLDEIQAVPSLLPVLRGLVDRPDQKAQFLILGSASPHLIRQASETLAGRVEFVELSGFDLSETGSAALNGLWLRGGFPRAFLAASDGDSFAWREGFVRTYLERDIPQLGFRIPAPALRRFWTMLAHYHGQTWNASELARALGLSDKTVRSYLDILTGTFMVRQVQPWFENLGKRQVKAPKVYFRDSGLLHHLMDISTRHHLLGHPRVGASWEGFAVEQVLRAFGPSEPYFWSTHGGAELDLVFQHQGKRLGFEIKFTEAPKTTVSMRTARADLKLDHLYVVHPGQHAFPMEPGITAVPLSQVQALPARS